MKPWRPRAAAKAKCTVAVPALCPCLVIDQWQILLLTAGRMTGWCARADIDTARCESEPGAPRPVEIASRPPKTHRAVARRNFLPAG